MPAFGPAALRDTFEAMLDIANQMFTKWEHLGPDSNLDVVDVIIIRLHKSLSFIIGRVTFYSKLFKRGTAETVRYGKSIAPPFAITRQPLPSF